MRLLFDQNLSHRLVHTLRALSRALIVGGALAVVGAAEAQQATSQRRAYGTVQVAPTFVTGAFDDPSFIELGAGGELLWPNGWGFAFDFSFLVEPESLVPGAVILSPGVFYEFSTDGKLRPYLRGGVSLVNLYYPLADVGGGVNYWFNDHIGLKGEFRYSIPPTDRDYGLISLRAGLNYRF